VLVRRDPKDANLSLTLNRIEPNPFSDRLLNNPSPNTVFMSSDKKTLVLPILLIATGMGWLLTTLDFVPGMDWVWTLALAALGVLAFAVGGFDKVTVVIGPFFMIASGLSILRQTGRIHMDVEIPILVIIMGVLLLIARASLIPIPSWVIENPQSDKV